MNYEWIEAGAWPDKNVRITARAWLEEYNGDEVSKYINGKDSMLYQTEGHWIAAPVVDDERSIADSFMIDLGPDLETAKIKFLLLAE